MTSTPVLREATADDCQAIADIYNHYVIHDTCTYDEVPGSLEQRREWLAKHGERHPVLVVESPEGILGWGSLSPFRDRSAYRYTVEDSLYLDPRWRRKGIGTMLLRELLRRARRLGYHAVIAGISAEQQPSIALHEKFGFTEVARLLEVGWKFDRWLDVVYMEAQLARLMPET